MLDSRNSNRSSYSSWDCNKINEIDSKSQENHNITFEDEELDKIWFANGKQLEEVQLKNKDENNGGLEANNNNSKKHQYDCEDTINLIDKFPNRESKSNDVEIKVQEYKKKDNILFRETKELNENKTNGFKN